VTNTIDEHKPAGSAHPTSAPNDALQRLGRRTPRTAGALRHQPGVATLWSATTMCFVVAAP